MFAIALADESVVQVHANVFIAQMAAHPRDSATDRACGCIILGCGGGGGGGCCYRRVAQHVPLVLSRRSGPQREMTRAASLTCPAAHPLPLEMPAAARRKDASAGSVPSASMPGGDGQGVRCVA
jgi:hypothetical protein